MSAPIITTHAIRRFAERLLGVRGLPEDDRAAVEALGDVHGLDVREIEKLLCAAVESGVACGASAVKLAGANFVLKNRSLVTVVKLKRPSQRRRVDPDDD